LDPFSSRILNNNSLKKCKLAQLGRIALIMKPASLNHSTLLTGTQQDGILTGQDLAIHQDMDLKP